MKILSYSKKIVSGTVGLIYFKRNAKSKIQRKREIKIEAIKKYIWKKEDEVN